MASEFHRVSTNMVVAGFTASGESHPALKQTFLAHYMYDEQKLQDFSCFFLREKYGKMM